MGDLRTKTCMLGMVSTNCYTVYREKEAVVIDPTDNGACIVNQYRELGVMPVAVLLAHGHFDHIMAMNDLRKLSLPAYAGTDEEALLRDTSLNLNTSFGHNFTTRTDQYVKDREMFLLLERTWKMIATPDHASDSMCCLTDDEDMLLSGSTLSTGSLGQTDFPTGSSGQIVTPITEKLFPLRDDIMVYPGRGESATVGHEEQYNPVATYRRWEDKGRMTGVLLDGNVFEQGIRELLMASYPGETFIHEERPEVSLYIGCKKNLGQTGYEIRDISYGTSTFHAFGVDKEEMSEVLCQEWEDCLEGRPVMIAEDNRLEAKDRIKRRLYFVFRSETGKQFPWGTLTGIRPSKITITLPKEGKGREEIAQCIQDTYLTSDEKIELTIKTAEDERELLSAFDYRSEYSLYIGAPLCPATYLYCPFASYPIGWWKERIQEYLNVLYKKMDYMMRTMAKRAAAAEQEYGTCTGVSQGLGAGGGPPHLDTVYFGGGTPTSPSAEDLDQLLAHLETTSPLSGIQELTMEAGRPDSITRGRLGVLKKHHITRISINPQTMKREMLDLIGHHHVVDIVRDCFHVARKLSFNNINMDLIVGLPEEDVEGAGRIMETVKALNPDSITVHSLTIKRASRLNIGREHYASLGIRNTQGMIDLTAAYAKEVGMEPYYLYRQKNMAGNFENVGYAKSDKACFYDILTMEERRTITVCGTGTATRIVFPEENRREWTENVKDVKRYIAHISGMIERKKVQKLQRNRKKGL